MKVMRCHALPIWPTRVQRRALERILEAERQLYNAALEQRIAAYRPIETARFQMIWKDDADAEDGGYYTRQHVAKTDLKSPVDQYSQKRDLTQLIAQDLLYGSIQRRIHTGTLGKLDKAFRAFFSRAKAGAGAASGFPRFKGRDFFDGFQFDAPFQVTIRDARIRFKGMTGGLRVDKKELAKLPPLVADPKGGGSWKGIGFKRDGDRWFVWLQVEHEIAITRAGKGKSSAGVDWGTSSLYVLSNGKMYPNPAIREDMQAEIAETQRKVSACKKGSRGRLKAKRRQQSVQRRERNRRKTYIGKATANLARHYAHLSVERLAARKMTARKTAEQIDIPVQLQTDRNRRALDAAPAAFRMALAYKCEREGTGYAEVDPAHTTQICSSCGTTVPKELANMEHACPSCGLTVPRKVNAARVIQIRGGQVPGRGGQPPRGNTSGPREGPADGLRSEKSDFHLPRKRKRDSE